MAENQTDRTEKRAGRSVEINPLPQPERPASEDELQPVEGGGAITSFLTGVAQGVGQTLEAAVEVAGSAAQAVVDTAKQAEKKMITGG